MKRTRAIRRACGAEVPVQKIEWLETRRLFAIVVNTTLDESVVNATTSLREAIAQAAANAGDDVITFDPTVFDAGGSHTITPSPTHFLIDDSGGELEIQGPGRDVLTISGSSAGRAFFIDAGVVTISGLTIADGAGETEGGGIYTLTTLTLDDVALTNNSVTGDNGADGGIDTAGEPGGAARGGAIYSAGGGVLTILNSNIAFNAANGGVGGSAIIGGGVGGSALGGAIYADNDLYIQDSDISGNSANGGIGGGSFGTGAGGGDASGGGLFIEASTSLTIINTTFSGNSLTGGTGADGGLAGSNGGAGGDALGGAIFSESDDASLIDASFSSNIVLGGAGGPPGAGGGVGVSGAGGAGFGGAVYNTGLITLNSGIINGNSVFGGSSDSADAGHSFGGAIYNAGTANIQNVQIAANSASGADTPGGTGGDGRGGAVYTTDELNVTDSLFTFNNAVGGAGSVAGGGYGGALYVTGANVSIDTTTITFNSATGGAGVDAASGTDGGIAHGGGIRNQTGVVTVTNSTIDNNTATGGAGGEGSSGGDGGDALGGGVSTQGVVEFANATVYGNAATGGAGGDGSGIGGAAGNGFGGGVYSNGIVNAINATFASNTSAPGAPGSGSSSGATGLGRGGGFYSTGNAAITNTIVDDNNATDSGDDLTGAFFALNSLVGTVTDGSYSLDVASSDNLLGLDADLGTLDDNGGPTQTALPDNDSPAVDAGDDAAAIAEFGIDGFDQRGAGFPRFQGTVDIGAVEIGGAVIVVSGNDIDIISGDTTPSAADNTSFGSVQQGAASPQRTFLVANTGSGTLTIDNLQLPRVTRWSSRSIRRSHRARATASSSRSAPRRSGRSPACY